MKKNRRHETPERSGMPSEDGASFRPGPARRGRRSYGATAIFLALLGGAAGHAAAGFDIPTGARPSPLFGAPPFSQQMLLFEEFGTQPLAVSSTPSYLPDPSGCAGPATPGAYTGALDAFLAQPLFPAPTREANTAQPNPWNASIGRCIGRQVSGPIEGRPPGEDFSHQRWDEFAPQVYFQSAQAGDRKKLSLSRTPAPIR